MAKIGNRIAINHLKQKVNVLIFDRYLKNAGICIKHQRVIHHNKMAERLNRSIVERAKCFKFDEDLEKSLWAEACNASYYLKKSIASSTISKTPYELWTGRKPNVSHLRVYGSIAMVHVPKIKRKKFDSKAVKHILVDYDDTIKGYRCYNRATQKIIISRDVTIMEKRCSIQSNTETTSIKDESPEEDLASGGEEHQLSAPSMDNYLSD